MKKFLIIATVTMTFLTVSAFAQKGKPKPSPSPTPAPSGDLPVRSTIHQSGDDALFYRIQSDSQGDYLNRTDSVESIIQGIGDWELNTRNSSVRKAFIHFGDPVTPGDTNYPFASGTVPMRFISKCSQTGKSLRNMVAGDNILCPLAIGFPYSGIDYAVRMQVTNYPGTEMVKWSCLSNGPNDTCNWWVMSPSVLHSDGEWKVRGQLMKLTPKKGAFVETLMGQFRFAFRVELKTP